jgi:hypothetical protein
VAASARRSLPISWRAFRPRTGWDWGPTLTGTTYEIVTAIAARRHGKPLPDIYAFRYAFAPAPALNALDRGEIEAQWRQLEAFVAQVFVTPEGYFTAALAKELFSLYDGLVRLSNAMPGLETLLAKIAAFPNGKHDDQVDVLSEGHLRGPSLWPRARPSRAAPAKLQIVSPKSRNQDLYDRRQWGRG